MRLWLILAGLNGAMGVMLDAYGWHELEADPFGREMFAFAARYQVWHALALVGVAFLAVRAASGRAAAVAGWCFQAGIILFCGALYTFGVLGSLPVVGAAPLGGLLLAAGWLAIAWAGYQEGRKTAD